MGFVSFWASYLLANWFKETMALIFKHKLTGCFIHPGDWSILLLYEFSPQIILFDLLEGTLPN